MSGPPDGTDDGTSREATGTAEVVAAAGVAAGLLAGGAVAQEITRYDYDVTALVIPGSDPELAGAALILGAPQSAPLLQHDGGGVLE